MITNFDQYQYRIDEGWKSDFVSMAVIFTFFFNSIVSSDTAKRYDFNFFRNYVKTLDIVNDDDFVKKAIEDVKYKISHDTLIANKQEVYNAIDSTIIVYGKDDYISNKLLQDQSADGLTMHSEDYSHSIIFLDRNSDSEYNTLVHELFHVVGYNVKIDPEISDMFNFSYGHDEQTAMLILMTDYNHNLKKALGRKMKKYLSKPSEIYSRLNTLKIFLYKNGFLSSPYQKFDAELLKNIFKGDIYRQLDEKAKEEFINSDFIYLLLFTDFNKIGYINQFVQNQSRETDLL